MNKIYTFLPILVSLLTFSSHSNGGWSYYGSSDIGGEFFIDYDRIRKKGDYIYFWVLRNYLEPDQWGDMSSMSYRKVSCQVPRKEKELQSVTYDQHFGKGNITKTMSSEEDWKYPVPNSIREDHMNIVCSQ